MELAPLERVRLEVEEGEPDPHRRKHLDQSQPPVREQQPHALKEHHEGADRKNERREDAPRPAELENRSLDSCLITYLDRANECACMALEGLATRAPTTAPAGPIRGFRRHLDPSIGARARGRIALVG